MAIVLMSASCVVVVSDSTALAALDNEDLKASLYLSGGTRDWTWQRNKVERQAILDEIERRHLMTESQVNLLLRRSRLNWPDDGETKEDVLADAGEPSLRSTNSSESEMWIYSTNIHGKNQIIADEKRVCFFRDRVVARSFRTSSVIFGESNSQNFVDSRCS
jgi:hypothetical protein